MPRVLMAILALCLLLPATALAQNSRQFGSALDKAPNANFGCETEPTFTSQSYDGAYRFLPSGDPDCTWFQAGVEGNPGNPLTGAVPGDGRITSVSVRSGPSPSPLRFTILTQLNTRGGGNACCYWRSETPLVQPRPNGVSTFAVNLPVQKNVELQTASQRGDYIGISGVSGAGTLPLFSNGRNNPLNDSGPGSLQAAFYYPRLQRRDQASGRNPSGIPGIEVLLRWTWCPGPRGAQAAQGCRSVGSTEPGGIASASLLGRRLRVRRGRVALRVRCLLDAGCRGRALLRTGGASASKRKARTIGSKRLKLKGGKTRVVKIKLNGRGRKLVRKRRRSKVTAVVDLGKAGKTTKKMTLRRR